MDFEVAKNAFIAGQDARFRERVALWARDETISNAEFSKKVDDLGWNLTMDRIAFFAELASQNAVDTASQDD